MNANDLSTENISGSSSFFLFFFFKRYQIATLTILYWSSNILINNILKLSLLSFQDIFDELLRILVSNYSYVNLSSYKVSIDNDFINYESTLLYLIYEIKYSCIQFWDISHFCIQSYKS